MSARFTAAILIVAGLLIAVDGGYACNLPPLADLTVAPEYVIVPYQGASVNVTLDASGSSDPDCSPPGGCPGLNGVKKFEFDTDNDGYFDDHTEQDGDPAGFDGEFTCAYGWGQRGVRTVRVRVTDALGAASIAECYLYINMKLSVPDSANGIDTIQGAVGIAVDGSIITVAEGTYTGPGNRDIQFYGKAIELRSTNPDDPDVIAATVIDCQGGHSQEGHQGQAHDHRNGPGLTGNEALAPPAHTSGHRPPGLLYSHVITVVELSGWGLVVPGIK